MFELEGITSINEEIIHAPKYLVQDKENNLPSLPPSIECSKFCPRKNCFYMNAEEIDSIKKELSLSKSQLHDFLLKRLFDQKKFGFNTDSFFVFGKIHLCHNALMKIFGISKYVVNKVLEEHSKGMSKFVSGNVGTLQRSDKKNKAVATILHFSKSQSENLPDRSVLQLPSYMTTDTIFQYYMEKCPSDLQVGKRQFQRHVCFLFIKHIQSSEL